MNQSEAKYFWPLIKAWAEGKTLQFKDPDTKVWHDCTTHSELGLFNPDDYRIKPGAQYRPWKAEEVPVGLVVVRYKNPLPTRAGLVALITAVTPEVFHTGSDSERFTFLQALEVLECSRDREHWEPCGTKAE